MTRLAPRLATAMRVLQALMLTLLAAYVILLTPPLQGLQRHWSEPRDLWLGTAILVLAVVVTAMRAALARAAGQFESEFGAAPRIRGSLHYGPVIVGEIGDVKRAIVFNGDVMNTAARLEELSRKVDGGFLASRVAMTRFSSSPPFAVRDLGRLEIRGRADGIDVVGIDAPVAAVA